MERPQGVKQNGAVGVKVAADGDAKVISVPVPNAAAIVITEAERLNLKAMVRQQNVADNTGFIRAIKHSDRISADLLKLQELLVARREAGLAPSVSLEEESSLRDACPFLYNNYTDLFHRVVRNELNMGMFAQFLLVLKMIEEEKIDAHEGSLVVGKLLKEVFVDSALRRGAHLDSAANAAAIKQFPPSSSCRPAGKPAVREISWAEFKEKQNCNL